MSHHHSVHIPIYEGKEDPRQHWFICDRMWDTVVVTEDDKEITQFAGALRKRALTWYMNFMDYQTISKFDIKENFLTFFKTKDVALLVVQELKEIKKVSGESVRDYDKRFKDLLSQIT